MFQVSTKTKEAQSCFSRYTTCQISRADCVWRLHAPKGTRTKNFTVRREKNKMRQEDDTSTVGTHQLEQLFIAPLHDTILQDPGKKV